MSLAVGKDDERLGFKYEMKNKYWYVLASLPLFILIGFDLLLEYKIRKKNKER